jgi:hypothetical protein
VQNDTLIAFDSVISLPYDEINQIESIPNPVLLIPREVHRWSPADRFDFPTAAAFAGCIMPHVFFASVWQPF